MSEYDDDLLKEGIMLARAKEYTTARRFLERAIDASDDLQTRMQAYFWLSEIASDPIEKRKCLEEVLAIDHSHALARRSLAILEGRLKTDEIVDPDHLPEATTEAQTVKTDRFTCPKCGGRMVYAADGRSLMCEFCQRNQALPQSRSNGKDFLVAMATIKGHSEPVAAQIFKCQGCGADFVLAPQVLSATCAYCGSDHVVALKKSRTMLPPDAIIPMAFDREQATQRLVHWVEANKLKPQGKVQALLGVYLPMWVFEAMGEIPWNGIKYRDKQRVAVSGRESIHYDDLIVPATSKLAGLAQKILSGYSLRAAIAFDPRYLAGWPAEVHELAMSDAALEARRMAVERIRTGIAIGEGDVQELRYSPSKIAIESFQLVLVPVWMTTVKLKEQAQRVIINGQSGIVHGETPSRGLLHWFDDLIGSG